MWYCYVLRCRDGSLYCGSTNNLDRRVEAHERGRAAKCTRSRRPVVLVWYRMVGTRGAALRREAAIKRLSKAAKERLVAGG